jgi:hypothetical protein
MFDAERLDAFTIRNLHFWLNVFLFILIALIVFIFGSTTGLPLWARATLLLALILSGLVVGVHLIALYIVGREQLRIEEAPLERGQICIIQAAAAVRFRRR